MAPTIVSGKADYTVTQLVGQFSDFNVHVCQVADGTQYLLKIASEVTKNGLLDREAFILHSLEETMKERDEAYKRQTGSEKGLSFDHCIPRLVESFVVNTQSQRRVNILFVYGADNVRTLVPLQQWRTREHRRIDPKSSAWMMGRILKIFTLTQPAGIAIGQVTGENILINPDSHHVTFFDWTKAMAYQKQVPQKIAREEIARAAIEVIIALGGDIENKTLPESDQLPDTRYAEMLFSLASGKVSDPFKAGQEFYGLLNELWGRSFHPFTTHPL